MPWIRATTFLIACACTSAWAAYPTGYDQGYIDAVNYCKAPLTTLDIDYHLTTITTTQSVLMTCFTDYAYTRSYADSHYRPQLWCTVAGEQWQWYQDHQTTPQTLVARTKQLLGLPMNNPGDRIVEFWVDPSSLFRPAVDESITNPVTDIDESTASAWYNARKAYIYLDATNPPYPWTRAGYTYDWGTGTSDHVGLSEFVARKTNETGGSPITVRAVFSPVSYLYYVRATDSFNVTGWCDTIWIGTKYLPATVGGNQIDIAANAVICRDSNGNGEGILVTDLAGQTSNVVINNQGLILGPGSATRNSSVSFENAGGVLNNSGIIIGDIYGVLGDNTCLRPIVINNSGTIAGTSDAIQTGGGDDVITTNGIITGNISTRGGDDVVNVTGGMIDGTIDGGIGDNVLNFNLVSGTVFEFDHDVLNMPNININSGSVLFDGSATSDVTIASQGILGGNCSLTGILTNWGTIAPGNSIGTIQVMGDYFQKPGGRYLVQIDRTAEGVPLCDRLIVSGTANFETDSIIQVAYDNNSGSVFRTGDMFDIIASGAMHDNGTGPTIVCNSAFLRFDGELSGGDYSLLLTRTGTFQSVASSANRAAIAGALDGDANAATGEYANLINNLLFSDANTFNNAMQQFIPAPYLSAYAATDRTTQYLAESTGEYLRKRRDGYVNWGLAQMATGNDSAFLRAVGSPSETAGLMKFCCDNENHCDIQQHTIDRSRSIWANPFGLFYGESSRGDHLGFQSNVAGAQFGIDRQVDEQWILGVSGVYCNTNLTTNDAYCSGRIDTFRVGPYTTWDDDASYMDMSLTGGFHDNNLGRYINFTDAEGTTQGNYHANDLSLYYGIGHDYSLNSYTLTPEASVQYIYYRQNSFDETGTDVSRLAIDARDANSLRSRVGGRVSSAVYRGKTKIVREVYAGWAHEYLGNDPLAGQFINGVTPFMIDAGGLFRDAGYYSLSLTAIPNQQTSLFTRYNGEYSSGGHFAAIDIGLIFAF